MQAAASLGDNILELQAPALFARVAAAQAAVVATQEQPITDSFLCVLPAPGSEALLPDVAGKLAALAIIRVAEVSCSQRCLCFSSPPYHTLAPYLRVCVAASVRPNTRTCGPASGLAPPWRLKKARRVGGGLPCHDPWFRRR